MPKNFHVPEYFRNNSEFNHRPPCERTIVVFLCLIQQCLCGYVCNLGYSNNLNSNLKIPISPLRATTSGREQLVSLWSTDQKNVPFLHCSVHVSVGHLYCTFKMQLSYFKDLLKNVALIGIEVAPWSVNAKLGYVDTSCNSYMKQSTLWLVALLFIEECPRITLLQWLKTLFQIPSVRYLGHWFCLAVSLSWHTQQPNPIPLCICIVIVEIKEACRVLTYDFSSKLARSFKICSTCELLFPTSVKADSLSDTISKAALTWNETQLCMNEESSTSLETRVKQLIATICSQVTHIMWLLGHRDKTPFFCQPTFPPNSKWKQIQRKGTEVILFPGTEKDAGKLMLRKHLWSCFYQTTMTQSNINVNSKTWGRGSHPSNRFRDRQMLARGFLSVALMETQALCPNIGYTRIKGL